MQDDSPPPSLEKLNEDLRAAQAKRRSGTKAEPGKQGKGLAFAMRIGVEIVAALIVGVGIGFFLDQWLGTKPWFLIAFFVLGAAAGFVNVFRVVGGLGGQVGYRERRVSADSEHGQSPDKDQHPGPGQDRDG